MSDSVGGLNRPVFVLVEGRAWIDRQSLAHLTRRSVNTIRARCPVAGHREGKAMYDVELCSEILGGIPTRARVAA